MEGGDVTDHDFIKDDKIYESNDESKEEVLLAYDLQY